MPGQSTPNRSRAMARLTGYPAACVLLVMFAAMADSSIADKSTTNDEIAYFTGGYSYYQTGDFRLFPEDGLLPQFWAALPLYIKGYEFPELTLSSWKDPDVWQFGRPFFYELGNDLDAMLRSGRRMIIVFGVILGLLVYSWSRRLFGPGGGMISLLLYVFSPNVLAHSRLATSDVAIAMTMTAAVWCTWRMLHRISVWSVMLCAVVSGLMFLSKTSSFLILPILLVLIVVRVASKRPLTVALWGERRIENRVDKLGYFIGVCVVNAGVIVLMIWAAHGFHYGSSSDDPAVLAWPRVLGGLGVFGPVIAASRTLHLLPEPFLYGFAHVVSHAAEREAFLNGQLSRTGWWYFFPYCLLVKTPLGIWAVMLAAAAATIARCGREAAVSRTRWAVHWLYRAAPLLALLSVYWAFAVTSNLNIGHRHLLVTLGPTFILAGASVYWMRRTALARAIVPLCVVGLIVASWSIRPHYLAFFNPIAGGPANGYRHLVDSSLDWGQDLPALRDRLKEHPQQQPVYLAYFGTGRPAYYEIDAIDLSGHAAEQVRFDGMKPLAAGVYCVSANIVSTWRLEGGGGVPKKLLAEARRFMSTSPRSMARRRFTQGGRREHWADLLRNYDRYRVAKLCDYLRRIEPDDQVGYSILIYALSDQQVRDALGNVR